MLPAMPANPLGQMLEKPPRAMLPSSRERSLVMLPMRELLQAVRQVTCMVLLAQTVTLPTALVVMFPVPSLVLNRVPTPLTTLRRCGSSLLTRSVG